MFLGVRFLVQDLSFLLGYAVFWFLSPIQSYTPWGSSEPGTKGAPHVVSYREGWSPAPGLYHCWGSTCFFGENI